MKKKTKKNDRTHLETVEKLDSAWEEQAQQFKQVTYLRAFRDMAERKARAIERIARALLRTSDEQIIMDVSLSLTDMPDRVVITCLKALDAVSPDALSPENKNRRAFACIKLAGLLLGQDASDGALEVLASTIMTVDDPTLKTILRQIAKNRC